MDFWWTFITSRFLIVLNQAVVCFYQAFVYFIAFKYFVNKRDALFLNWKIAFLVMNFIIFAGQKSD